MYDFNDLNDNYELKDEFKNKIKVKFITRIDWRRNKKISIWWEFNDWVTNNSYSNKRSSYSKINGKFYIFIVLFEYVKYFWELSWSK